jgi:hypothetical protein
LSYKRTGQATDSRRHFLGKFNSGLEQHTSIQQSSP